MINKNRILDFEIDRGTKVIPIEDIRRCLNVFEYGKAERIYLILLALSLRTDEPMQLTWDNFFKDYSMLIFRPKKQNSKTSKKSVVRKIRLPQRFREELLHYKNHNHFKDKKLFPFTSNTFRDRFNKIYRKRAGSNWTAYNDNIRPNKTQGLRKEHKFILRSFRTTAATIIFYYYSKVWENAGDMALVKTCQFMCHSHKFMTANYYVQRAEQIGLEKIGFLPYLQLMDTIIYNEIQVPLTKFAHKKETQQTRLEEYSMELVV